MTKLIVALRQLGYSVDQVQFDHQPPLALRRWDDKAGDYDPPQHHPDFIQIMTIDEHKQKTHGTGGEKRATVADGDLHKIRRASRLAKETEEFRARILKPGKSKKPKRTPWGLRKRK